MTAAPAPDVTYRTDATDEEFADRIAAFDGAEYPPEVAADAERERDSLRRSVSIVSGLTEDEIREVGDVPQPADAGGTGR